MNHLEGVEAQQGRDWALHRAEDATYACRQCLCDPGTLELTVNPLRWTPPGSTDSIPVNHNPCPQETVNLCKYYLDIDDPKGKSGVRAGAGQGAESTKTGSKNGGAKSGSSHGSRGGALGSYHPPSIKGFSSDPFPNEIDKFNPAAFQFSSPDTYGSPYYFQGPDVGDNDRGDLWDSLGFLAGLYASSGLLGYKKSLTQ
ncbi:hypothetical protein TWF481_008723 [Arthrobotrys musiformis]|uniref:Uncharacterized protein n=1 Tax=Arthrobotrys musiformis TaxID=47236 RepID=A0AAV9W820_9PEZI